MMDLLFAWIVRVMGINIINNSFSEYSIRQSNMRAQHDILNQAIKLQEDEFQQICVEEDNGFGSSVSHMFNSLNSAYSSSIRSISQLATNLAYNAKHSSCPFVQRKAIYLKPDSQPVYLLGKKYEPSQKDQFDQAFHSIIWICYRSELEGKSGDVGWGCMIRVCQMVLAQALKRCSPHKHSSQIIKQFSSSATALFSFDRICMQGKVMNRWTSSTQVILALQDLLKEQQKFKLNIQMYNGQTSIDDIEDQTSYPLLIVIHNRLGSNNIEEKMRDHLNMVLQHQNSMGMISGIGGEAIYVAGYHEDQLIALDPHYVQSEVEGEKSYLNRTARGVSLQKIVPSVGFCFYFQNPEQHRRWFYDLAESCHFHSPNIVIQCDAEFSKQIYIQRHPRASEPESEEQFQILK